MNLTPEQIASFPWNLISRIALQVWLDRQQKTGHQEYLCFLAQEAAGSPGRCALERWLRSVGIDRSGNFTFMSYFDTFAGRGQIKAYPPELANNELRRLHIVKQLLEGAPNEEA